MRIQNYVWSATLAASFVLLSSDPLLATSASDYRTSGLAYRNQGRLPEAIATLRKAVELDDRNLTGRVNLGWTLHLANQDREAAEVLQQTAAIDPAYAPTFNALGIVYLVNNDLISAALIHNWAALIAPDNEIAFYNLSLAYQRMQQYDWAIAAAQKAVTLEPENPHPLIALAIAHWGKQESAIAQRIYRQAIQIDARYQSGEFLDRLAEAGMSDSQTEQAEQILRAVRVRSGSASRAQF